MAKRNGHTLIVTLLHCPALTEIDAAKNLLNWGFKIDGTVAPIGALVSPRSPAAAAPNPRTPGTLSHPAIAAQRATRAQAGPGGPSMLAAAGFTVAALLVAGFGFAYSRRQRPARRQSPGGPGASGAAGSRAGGASGPRPRAGDDRSTVRRP
jgi:D-alanyl-D-alanine carboxypeptidase (penicillin-binding protein 5/6)